MTQYCDLDEFLSENGLPVEGDQQQNGTTAGGNGVNQGTIVAPNHQGAGALMPGVNGRLSPPPPASIHPIQHLQTNGAGGVGAILTKREPSPSPSEPLSPITINPPSPADSSEFPSLQAQRIPWPEHIHTSASSAKFYFSMMGGEVNCIRSAESKTFQNQ